MAFSSWNYLQIYFLFASSIDTKNVSNKRLRSTLFRGWQKVAGSAIRPLQSPGLYILSFCLESASLRSHCASLTPMAGVCRIILSSSWQAQSQHFMKAIAQTKLIFFLFVWEVLEDVHRFSDSHVLPSEEETDCYVLTGFLEKTWSIIFLLAPLAVRNHCRYDDAEVSMAS